MAPRAMALGSSLRVLDGRAPDRRTVVADLTDEVTALHAEAVELTAACLPLAHRLFFAAQVIGPEMAQTAMQLIARLERHDRQHGRAA